jgi:hypothetical protein
MLNHRFEEVKASLLYPFDEYTTYSNNHPYVWGEVDFEQTRRWLFESVNAKNFVPNRLKFSLKKDDDIRAIYIGVGTESFDWSSLKHYEEWLESNQEVSQNILKNRNRADLN